MGANAAISHTTTFVAAVASLPSTRYGICRTPANIVRSTRSGL